MPIAREEALKWIRSQPDFNSSLIAATNLDAPKLKSNMNNTINCWHCKKTISDLSFVSCNGVMLHAECFDKKAELKKMKENDNKTFSFNRYRYGGLGGEVHIKKWMRLVLVFGSHDKASPVTESYTLHVARTNENLICFMWSFRILGWDIWHITLELNNKRTTFNGFPV